MYLCRNMCFLVLCKMTQMRVSSHAYHMGAHCSHSDLFHVCICPYIVTYVRRFQRLSNSERTPGWTCFASHKVKQSNSTVDWSHRAAIFEGIGLHVSALSLSPLRLCCLSFFFTSVFHSFLPCVSSGLACWGWIPTSTCTPDWMWDMQLRKAGWFIYTLRRVSSRSAHLCLNLLTKTYFSLLLILPLTLFSASPHPSLSTSLSLSPSIYLISCLFFPLPFYLSFFRFISSFSLHPSLSLLQHFVSLFHFLYCPSISALISTSFPIPSGAVSLYPIMLFIRLSFILLFCYSFISSALSHPHLWFYW